MLLENIEKKKKKIRQNWISSQQQELQSWDYFRLSEQRKKETKKDMKSCYQCKMEYIS